MKTETNYVGEYREDSCGVKRCMAQAEGYLMVRRPRCTPHVMSVKEWERLGKVEGRKRVESRLGIPIYPVPAGVLPTGVLGMILSFSPEDPRFDPKKHLGIIR